MTDAKMERFRTRLWDIGKLLFLVVVLASGCADPWAGRGGADETSNGITARIVDRDGHPLRHVLVLVRPADYVARERLAPADPAAGIYNLVTDEEGLFTLDSMPPGDYVLEARAKDQGIVLRFTVDSLNGLATVVDDSITLLPYGAVSGRIALPPDAGMARVVLLGIDRLVYTGADGSFDMNEVSPGVARLVALMPDRDIMLGELQIVLAADSVFNLGLIAVDRDFSEQAWQFSARVVLNTRSSGVRLTEILVNYPLPVFLRGADFPREALSQGADMRVTDFAGNALPFAISYWNEAAEEALLWVRLDSVRPGDSAVVARLWWGCPGSLSASRPDRVFDSLSQWAAVIPLQTVFRDSVGALRTPVYSFRALSGIVFSTEGVAPEFSWLGTWFDGVEQGVGIHGLPLDFGSEDYTVEVWLRPENEGGIWLSRDNKSEGNWNHAERAFYFGAANTSVTEAKGLQPVQVTHGRPYNNYARAADSVRLYQWVHLALRRSTWSGDTALVEWFIDGKPVHTFENKVLDEADDPRDTVYIATRMFGRSYQGWMRQLQISRVARSHTWIAFDAEVQRIGSPVVRIVR